MIWLETHYDSKLIRNNTVNMFIFTSEQMRDIILGDLNPVINIEVEQEKNLRASPIIKQLLLPMLRPAKTITTA